MRGGFSTKQRGVVQVRFAEGYIENVEFRVSLAGNTRVVRDGIRNVHAYAVSDTPPVLVNIPGDNRMKEIKYNPFKGIRFTINGRPVFHVDVLYFKDGKCYTM